MKRWLGALATAVLSAIFVLLHHSTGSGLLEDSDTRVLLWTIKQKNSPFSWFAGDWPLHNHFYRPVSTLFFEMDRHLYNSNAAGFGLTNALICAICTLLLFWFLRELTDRPLISALSTVLFAIWETGTEINLIDPALLLALGIFFGGMIRHGKQLRYYVPGALVAYELAAQLRSAHFISNATMGWLPGRTATVMTLFALPALASYARYERLGELRRQPTPTPLDPPATRNTTVTKRKKAGFGWIVLCLLCGALSLASYEQAVMVPGLLLATACTFYWMGRRVRWGWQVAFWGLLLGYVALRHALVPSAPSSYQLQQFRTGPGVWISIGEYALPGLYGIVISGAWISGLPLALMTSEPYMTVIAFASDLATIVKARPRWVLTFAAYGMSLLAFLPMAWLKQFEHYHYLPLAFKSLFVVMVGWLAVDQAIIAWSPRTDRAPPRRDPAPGSLPHP